MLLSFTLIVVGILYIAKPDLYNRRLFSKESAVGQQTFSIENYRLLMRILGAVLIIVGIVSVWKHI